MPVSGACSNSNISRVGDTCLGPHAPIEAGSWTTTLRTTPNVSPSIVRALRFSSFGVSGHGLERVAFPCWIGINFISAGVRAEKLS